METRGKVKLQWPRTGLLWVDCFPCCPSISGHAEDICDQSMFLHEFSVPKVSAFAQSSILLLTLSRMLLGMSSHLLEVICTSMIGY